MEETKFLTRNEHVEFVLRMEQEHRGMNARLKGLEGDHKALQELATSVALMAQQMQTLNTSVEAVAEKVDELESKPAKRWEGIVDKAIWAVLGAFIAYCLGQVGL